MMSLLALWDFISPLLPMIGLAAAIGAGVIYVYRHPEKL